EREIAGVLAEVELRGRLGAVDAVSPRDVVAVEREDLALGVALLDLQREDQLAELPFPGLLVRQEEIPGELLRERARPRALPVEDVLYGGDDDARDAEPEVLLERLILGRDDRLPQQRRDLVVADDDPALRGELADELAVPVEDPRDDAWRVVVERRDVRQILGRREQQAGERAGCGHDQEEQDDGCAAGETDDVSGHKLPGGTSVRPVVEPGPDRSRRDLAARSVFSLHA